MRKLVSVFIITCMLFMADILNVSAGYSVANKKMYEQAIQKACIFANAVLGENEYERVVELLDFNEEVKYLFLDFGNEGYVIVNVDNNMVIEARKEKNEYITDDGTYYYNGPLSYYKKIDEKYIDLKSGYEMAVESAEIAIADFSKCCEEGIYAMARGNIEYEVTVDGKVHNYNYNGNGICSTTATAIWLAYMDAYVSDNYVDNEYCVYGELVGKAVEDMEVLEDREKAYINSIVEYIDGMVPNADLEDIKNGLQQYLYERKIMRLVNASEKWSSRVYKACIADDIPVIMGLSSYKYASGNPHAVVAYGYFVYLNNIESVIISDGLGSTAIYISPAYIDGFVY